VWGRFPLRRGRLLAITLCPRAADKRGIVVVVLRNGEHCGAGVGSGVPDREGWGGFFEPNRK
jgi:hypothetical protein